MTMKNRDKTEGQLSVPLSLRDFYCAFCIEGQGQIIYLSLSRLVKMTRDRDRDRYIYNIYICPLQEQEQMRGSLRLPLISVTLSL
nr:MAG TPA: hypothetical protein [Caudoviricetes sp.]